MNFIQNDHTVVRKVRISQDLSEQTAIGHVLHHCVLSQAQTPRKPLELCRRPCLFSNVCRLNNESDVAALYFLNHVVYLESEQPSHL